RNLAALSYGGWIVASLSEGRNRADLVMIIGEDVFDRFPRLVERCLSPEPAYQPPGTRRRLIILGKAPSQSLPGHIDATIIPLERERFGEFLASLRLALAGNENPTVSNGPLKALADTLKSARYGVITWSAGSLNFPQSELAIQAAVDLTKAL